MSVSSITRIWESKSNRQIIISSAVYFLLIIVLKNRYDYLEYEKHWTAFLEGNNPWNYGSAYGPLHNVMGYLYALSHKLPRLVFAGLAIAASVYLIKHMQKAPIDPGISKVSFYLLLYNPLVWIFFVVNGCNDGFVGFFFLFGIVFYDQKKFFLSAIFLSLAIFYKFLPLFVLPVLFINNRKIHWRFTLSILGILAVGFLTAYLFWGDSFLDPFFLNADRESKILSVFRYLRGEYSVLKLTNIDNLDHLSIYLVLFSVLFIFILQLIYRYNYLKSVILTLLAVHMFYLVGHFQFYISIYLLLFFYIIKLSDKVKNTLLIRRILLFQYWIAGTTLLYGITEGFYQRFHVIREFIGLPHFIFLIITIVSILYLDRIKGRLDTNPL